MNVQDQIVQELGDKMHSAMDFEILADVLCRFGWNRIDIERFMDNHHAIDITYWLKDNCRGQYHREGRCFLFKESSDAVMFTLRWK